MKISNLVSQRSGAAVRNQFNIDHDGIAYFQSYDSLIAKWDGRTLTIGRDWDYSTTTLKYLKQWMEENCYPLYRRIMNQYKGSFKSRIEHACKDKRIVHDEFMNY